jgi:hypothetical protein
VPAGADRAAPVHAPAAAGRDGGAMAAAVEQAIGRGDIEGFVVGGPRPASHAVTPCGPTTAAAAGALVYVDGIADPPGARVEPPKPVELRFSGCALAPPLAVAPAANAQVALSTVDPLRHEATLALAPAPGAPPAQATRLPLPLEGQRFVIDEQGPGVLHVGCALHEGEKAAIVLPAHRHHVLADAEGRFRLSDVPAGKHKLVAWSPDGRRVEAEAVVVPDGTVSVTLKMP